MEPLDYELVLPAPRDEVWRAFTTPDGLTQWLAPRARVEAVVGGPYELFWAPPEAPPESNSTLGCRVLSVDPPRLLRFTWRGSDEVADVMNAPGAPVTEVTVALTPALDGTRLRLTHAGWGEVADWARARAWFDAAWTNALRALRAHLGGGGRDAG
jgi:uncharacterized protein YndB with AHSA1/START domain